MAVNPHLLTIEFYTTPKNERHLLAAAILRNCSVLLIRCLLIYAFKTLQKHIHKLRVIEITCKVANYPNHDIKFDEPPFPPRGLAAAS